MAGAMIGGGLIGATGPLVVALAVLTVGAVHAAFVLRTPVIKLSDASGTTDSASQSSPRETRFQVQRFTSVAIFSSAAALGVDAVLVSPRCGDPLSCRSVRVSMGTVFQVPWARLESRSGDLEWLKEQGFTVAAMELTDDAVELDAPAASNPGKLAPVLGTEGPGMSAETLAAVGLAVKAGVDSLNVAAASAVAALTFVPASASPKQRLYDNYVNNHELLTEKNVLFLHGQERQRQGAVRR